MILRPFTVRNGGVDYRFVQRQALDSEVTKLQVDDLVRDNHGFSQFEAMCAQIGLAEGGSIPHLRFGVFVGSELVGIWGLAKLTYISGPWDNTSDWNVTSPGAVSKWTCRPMPGLRDLGDLEFDVAVDVAVAFLTGPFTSMEGTAVELTELHWAVLKTGTDPISVRARALHVAAQDDRRLRVTETPDPRDSRRTLARVELG
jgi:hypothetical protein